MADRVSWASRFWLLLCVASLLGSLFVWTGQRSAQRPRTGGAAAVLPAEPASVANPPPAPTESTPIAAATPAGTPLPIAAAAPPPPVVIESNPAPKVRRCAVRGRVSYVDAAATCPDGSAGRITLLPR